MSKKLLTIVGARPQFVKAAMVSKAVVEHGNFEEKILHTGQHFDANMSDLFFEEMSIPKPYKNLSLAGAGLHGSHTGMMLAKLEEEMISLKPDMVLVYGDTNSTLAGALAASKLHIPIAHVEAGMRCYNKKVPEEVNRVIADHLSAILLCSTQESVQNLAKESIDRSVYHVGDVMVDAVYFFKIFGEQQMASNEIKQLIDQDYFLLTLHRQETTDNPDHLGNIFKALAKSKKKIIFPIHPRTKNVLAKHNITVPSSVILTEPQGYIDMIRLIANSKAVFTDSGGLQKESVVLQKRCYTLREQTEWTETVKEGWNTLLGYDSDRILSALEEATHPVSKSPFPTEKYYGDGHASRKVVEHISKYLG